MNNPTNREVFPAWLRWFIGAITFLAFSILILAIVLGVRAGQEQLEIRNRQQVGIFLQRAIDLKAAGNYVEAYNEYQRVLTLDANNQQALESLQELQQILEPTAPQQQNLAASAVGDSAADEPTTAGEPIAEPTLDTRAQLWEKAQSAFTAGRWQETIDLVRQMQRIDGFYQINDANALLYTVYLKLAAEKERTGDLEEALAYLDQALAVRPTGSEARTAQILISKYLDALTLSGANWKRAVEVLQELYQLDSGYRDVRERLQRAHMEYADSLVQAEAWCEAVVQYDAAIEIQITPGATSKRNRYQALCGDDIATIPDLAQAGPTTPNGESDSESNVSGPGITVSNNGLGGPIALAPVDDGTDRSVAPDPTPAQAVSGTPSSGRILYSAIDPGDRRNRIFLQQVGSNENPTMLVEDAAQPAMRGDGARLVYRNLRADAIGLTSYDPGGELSLRFTKFSEDSLPSWSADGNRLVFASNREGDRLWRIYTVWAEEEGAMQNHSFGEAPEWHPISDLIVFRGCDERGNGCGLWTMTGNGGDRNQLTNVPADTLPSWTPLGDSVVFMSGARHGNTEIYRVDVATRNVIRLTEHLANDVSPTVAPDGQWVAFLSDRNSVWTIWAIPISGGEPQILTPLTGELGHWLEQDIQWIP